MPRAKVDTETKTTTKKSSMGLTKRGAAAKKKATEEAKKIVIPDEKNTYRCLRCGTEHHSLKDHYYKYNGTLWTGWYEFDKTNKPILYLPICKPCMQNLFDSLTKRYFGDEKKAMKRLCAMMDIGYSEDLFNTTNNPNKGNKEYTRISSWFQRMPMKQYPHTFDDYFDDILSIDRVYYGDENQVGEEAVNRFGTGYDSQDYLFLEKQYQEWRNDCGDDTKPKRELIKRICFIQLQIHKKQLVGEPTKDLDKTLQDMLSNLNALPKQSKLDGDLVNKYTLGEMLANFEQEEPIIDIDEEFEDVDNCKLYIDTFFKGGLAAGMGLKGNFFDTLYHKFMDKYTAKRIVEEEDHELQKLEHAIFGDDDDD